MTGEQVESGIKSGNIPMASTFIAVKKPFVGKKETNVVYGQRSCIKNDHYQSVEVVLILNPTPIKRPQQSNNQQSPDVPRRQFTRINMPLSQALQHLLKASLVMLRDPPPNPNIASPKYNPNVK